MSITCAPRRRRMSLALAIAASIGTVTEAVRAQDASPAPPRSDSERVRDQRWREDLDALWTGLRDSHPAPLGGVTADERVAQVRAIDARIPTLTDDEIVVEFMRFTAAIGDDHTLVDSQIFAASRLPIVLVGWPDGVRLVRAPAAHAKSIGQRLIRVGAFAIEDVLDELARVQSMTPAWRVRMAPQLLPFAGLLAGMGLVEPGEPVPMTFADDDGAETTISLSPAPLPADAAGVKVLGDAVTNQRGALWHHAQWLADERILYVQYNRCATSPEHDLDAFVGKLVDHVSQTDVAAIVFDLQYNGGGNSALGDAMFRRLAAHEPMRRKRGVYALIGVGTFSSALMNAMTLKARHGAVLIGTDTGGAPDHFGEVRTFALPHSKVKVWHSTKRFGRADGKRTTLSPDVVAARTFADFVAGRDPLLDAVRRHLKETAGAPADGK